VKSQVKRIQIHSPQRSWLTSDFITILHKRRVNFTQVSPSKAFVIK